MKVQSLKWNTGRQPKQGDGRCVAVRCRGEAGVGERVGVMHLIVFRHHSTHERERANKATAPLEVTYNPGSKK